MRNTKKRFVGGNTNKIFVMERRNKIERESQNKRRLSKERERERERWRV